VGNLGSGEGVLRVDYIYISLLSKRDYFFKTGGGMKSKLFRNIKEGERFNYDGDKFMRVSECYIHMQHGFSHDFRIKNVYNISLNQFWWINGEEKVYK
jgi:hypothetical protein